ncbi:Xaa-Pro peptidase family protein [Mesorhizobium sp. B3-2-1]|uniref:M24 family metallopeptidase n=1 Tax=Mesorhizobium sp. B3-2-1 TaxID=2589891 RepID=UPI001AEDFD5E|nr:Xaa-Pro peptidase family protein [Mesorhizobium sp. B3-2-1]
MSSHAITPADEIAIRTYRLDRLRKTLAAADIGAVLLFDPVNIRYATGSRNMQVWTMHNACRYAFVPASGPVVLFDYSRTQHLSRHLETINEIRPAISWDFFAAGDRYREQATSWANEISELLWRSSGNGARLAIDRADLLPLEALHQLGIEVVDAKPYTEAARAIKSFEEIKSIRDAVSAGERAMAAMHSALAPGERESDMLAILSLENIASGGEYMETRLLTSGPRTNPWLQETSDRVMEAGDMMAFDTDLIGRHGVFVDISRAWIVGDLKPTDEQRTIYDLAREQLECNMALLRPGVEFREFAEKAWPMPEIYAPNRYAEMIHGAGLGVEYPLVYYIQDWEAAGYDGQFEENMVVCVESYIGAVGGREGVKLEQQVLITSTGPEVLSHYRFENDRW